MRFGRIILAVLLGTALPARAIAPAVPETSAQPAEFDPASSLTAPMAFMVDLGSGRVLFERDADRRFLPASLVKVMTAYVAFEMLGAGRIRRDQNFAMSDAAFAKWRGVGSRMFIAQGQAISVDELLTGIMTVSANDGSIVLAEGASGSVGAFTAEMNATARRLGMRNSHFGSPNGWPDGGVTYTTARDLAIVTQAMISRYPGYYRRYVGHRQMTFNGITQPNHVPVLGAVSGADGVKTGFTNEAGYGFVGSGARGGRRVVMVVGGYDRAWLRARESRAFLEWGLQAWSARPLFAAGETVGMARVQGGASRSVPLVAPMPYYLTVAPRETAPVAKLSVRYEGPLEAPVRQGSTVGSLRIAVRGEPPRDVPLLAGKTVARANDLQRLRNGLAALVGL